MPPIVLLAILIGITFATAAIARWRQQKNRAIYQRLATENRMHYSQGDPLRLTPRIAASLPIPGAAGVRILDLLYRTDEENHHYIFTAEYTVGVIGPKHRVRRVAAFTERKLRGDPTQPIDLAPINLPLIEQYRALITSQIPS